MKKLLASVLLLMLAFSFAFAGGKQEAAKKGDGKLEIVMVVKLEGVAWFDNMRIGIEKFSAEHPDVHAYQIGADTADPAAQVALINDLVAKKVNAILAVPNDRIPCPCFQEG